MSDILYLYLPKYLLSEISYINVIYNYYITNGLTWLWWKIDYLLFFKTYIITLFIHNLHYKISILLILFRTVPQELFCLQCILNRLTTLNIYLYSPLTINWNIIIILVELPSVLNFYMTVKLHQLKSAYSRSW